MQPYGMSILFWVAIIILLPLEIALIAIILIATLWFLACLFDITMFIVFLITIPWVLIYEKVFKKKGLAKDYTSRIEKLIFDLGNNK